MQLELRKLGLTEKEAKVYLAGLELPPSSVKFLAEKIKMTRPTVYEIIKRLEEKRLFSELKEGKKRLFTAQSPESVLGILRTKKKELEEREREFIRIIATLEARYPKGGIKIFRGRDGLRALEEIISFSSTPEIFIFNNKNCPIKAVKMKRIFQEIKKRLGKISITQFNSKIAGSLIVADKTVFFPKGKKEGFLLF